MCGKQKRQDDKQLFTSAGLEGLLILVDSTFEDTHQPTHTHMHAYIFKQKYIEA